MGFLKFRIHLLKGCQFFGTEAKGGGSQVVFLVQGLR
jgi:hypothetical protein